MDITIVLSIGILVLLLLLAVAFLVFKKKKKAEPDYYTFFIMGIIWLGAGIPLGNYALSAMGAVFMVVGLLNRDKWKKQKKWSELTEEERRLKIILIGALFLLVLAGVAAYFLVDQGLVEL